MLLAAGLKTTFRTQFLNQFIIHLPNFIFLHIITTYYDCKFHALCESHEKIKQISIDYYPLSCSVRTGRYDDGHGRFSKLRERLKKFPTLPVRLAYTDNIGDCSKLQTLCVRRGCNHSMSSPLRTESMTLYDTKVQYGILPASRHLTHLSST